MIFGPLHTGSKRREGPLSNLTHAVTASRRKSAGKSAPLTDFAFYIKSDLLSKERSKIGAS